MQVGKMTSAERGESITMCASGACVNAIENALCPSVLSFPV